MVPVVHNGDLQTLFFIHTFYKRKFLRRLINNIVLILFAYSMSPRLRTMLVVLIINAIAPWALHVCRASWCSSRLCHCSSSLCWVPLCSYSYATSAVQYVVYPAQSAAPVAYPYAAAPVAAAASVSATAPVAYTYAAPYATAAFPGGCVNSVGSFVTTNMTSWKIKRLDGL